MVAVPVRRLLRSGLRRLAEAKGGSFSDADHPRYPAGDPRGGQFAPKGGAASGSWPPAGGEGLGLGSRARGEPGTVFKVPHGGWDDNPPPVHQVREAVVAALRTMDQAWGKDGRERAYMVSEFPGQPQVRAMVEGTYNTTALTDIADYDVVGSTIYHNHPVETSLSPGDILATVAMRDGPAMAFVAASGIVAATPTREYSLRLKDPSSEGRLARSEAAREVAIDYLATHSFGPVPRFPSAKLVRDVVEKRLQEVVREDQEGILRQAMAAGWRPGAPNGEAIFEEVNRYGYHLSWSSPGATEFFGRLGLEYHATGEPIPPRGEILARMIQRIKAGAP